MPRALARPIDRGSEQAAPEVLAARLWAVGLARGASNRTCAVAARCEAEVDSDDQPLQPGPVKKRRREPPRGEEPPEVVLRGAKLAESAAAPSPPRGAAYEDAGDAAAPAEAAAVDAAPSAEAPPGDAADAAGADAEAHRCLNAETCRCAPEPVRARSTGSSEFGLAPRSVRTQPSCMRDAVQERDTVRQWLHHIPDMMRPLRDRELDQTSLSRRARDSCTRLTIRFGWKRHVWISKFPCRPLQSDMVPCCIRFVSAV